MIDFTGFNIKNDIIYLTKETTFFSDAYIKAREKEQRLLSDNDVLKLPYLNKFEWPYRVKSTNRFVSYITTKNKPLTILDIGCGNGWFSNKMADITNTNYVIGLDINKSELEQAARIFKTKNLQFVYANIFNCDTFFNHTFDIITLNGSLQYFKDFNVLFSKLNTFLKPKGEIHIIDTPFYSNKNIKAARLRTLAYYTKLGVPEMAEHYFHFNQSYVQNFKQLYRYKKYTINRLLGKKDSPFSWYCYSKP